MNILLLLLLLLTASKLDYCNVALVSLTRCDLDRLQSVINAAARLTVAARHYDHISPLLVDLHWLQMAERIQYKLYVLVSTAFTDQHHATFNRQSVRWRAWNHGVVWGQSHIRPDGACYMKVNTGWPCLRCSRTTGLKQSAGRHSSLFITLHFQTLTQDSSFSAEFFLHCALGRCWLLITITL